MLKIVTRFALALMLAASGPFAALAQETATVTTQPVRFPFVVMDAEAVYQRSQFGQDLAAHIAAETAALTAENDAISAQLEAEELALTEERPNLTPEEFRARADAFDARVQSIRADRLLTAQDLERQVSVGREQFDAAVNEVIGAVAVTRGAGAVLERRLVVLAADAIDITAEVIARMDSAYAAGEILYDPAEGAPDTETGATDASPQ